MWALRKRAVSPIRGAWLPRCQTKSLHICLPIIIYERSLFIEILFWSMQQTTAKTVRTKNSNKRATCIQGQMSKCKKQAGKVHKNANKQAHWRWMDYQHVVGGGWSNAVRVTKKADDFYWWRNCSNSTKSTKVKRIKRTTPRSSSRAGYVTIDVASSLFHTTVFVCLFKRSFMLAVKPSIAGIKPQAKQALTHPSCRSISCRSSAKTTAPTAPHSTALPESTTVRCRRRINK